MFLCVKMRLGKWDINTRASFSAFSCSISLRMEWWCSAQHIGTRRNMSPPCCINPSERFFYTRKSTNKFSRRRVTAGTLNHLDEKTKANGANISCFLLSHLICPYLFTGSRQNWMCWVGLGMMEKHEWEHKVVVEENTDCYEGNMHCYRSPLFIL